MKLTTQQKILLMQFVYNCIDFDGLGYQSVNEDKVKQLRECLIAEMGKTKKIIGVHNSTSEYYYVAKLAEFLKCTLKNY